MVKFIFLYEISMKDINRYQYQVTLWKLVTMNPYSINQ